MAIGWDCALCKFQAWVVLLLLTWPSLWRLWYKRCFMDGDHPSLSRCVVSFSLMVCSGHHLSLRLLSLLRVMNISPSTKKKKKHQPIHWRWLWRSCATITFVLLDDRHKRYGKLDAVWKTQMISSAPHASQDVERSRAFICNLASNSGLQMQLVAPRSTSAPTSKIDGTSFCHSSASAFAVQWACMFGHAHL